MTLFLIILIVFLCAWGCQTLIKKAKKSEYRARTKTNVELEKNIQKKWAETLCQELDVVATEEPSVFNHITKLYAKYDIPLYPWISDENEKQRFLKSEQSLSDFAEKQAQDSRITHYAFTAGTSHMLHPKYESCKSLPQHKASVILGLSNLSDDEIARRHDLYMNVAPRLKDTCSAYLSLKSSNVLLDEARKKDFLEAFGSDYPMLPDSPPRLLFNENRTLLQRMRVQQVEGSAYFDYSNRSGLSKMVNLKACNHMWNLILLLTKRDLAEKGYVLSQDGLHESEWQEFEKKLALIDQNMEQYPWLFHPINNKKS